MSCRPPATSWSTASSNEAAALKAAQERLAALRILAGTAPAKGPGIRMTIDDPGSKVTAPVMLDALEELRDAGAEAVQINGSRVVASSSFGQAPTGVQVDGSTLHSPYRILAIGNPQTMACRDGDPRRDLRDRPRARCDGPRRAGPEHGHRRVAVASTASLRSPGTGAHPHAVTTGFPL